MKVLVTGATGFVGSHVADRLLESGHEVRALTRSSSKLHWLEGKPIENVKGDILDADSLRDAMTGINAVVHIAGVTAAKSRQAFFEGNQLATRALLEAAQRFNPEIDRFILGSSLTAVGPSLDGEPVTERTPPHPITTYGQSKRAAEEEAERAREHFPVTILRLSAVYGPRDTAILTFFQTVKNRLKPLIGMRDKRVNLVHVADVALSVDLALSRPEALNETYMIGSEDQYTWREVSDMTAQILERRGLTLKLPHALVYSVAGFSELISLFRKKPSVLNWEKGKDMVQENWTCNVTKAMQQLGYKQSMHLELGLRNTIEWYRKQGWL
jgi:nucleoside-diphosphate-sugar epimerase